MDRRLRVALALAPAIQWPLVAAMFYRMSYDAYVHLFLADHYRRNWWSLWETRWYTGFSVASYPPLVHQLIALLSFPLGMELAWAAVLLSVLIALPGSVYAFARVFVGRRAAGYAAVASAVLPSIYLTAHTFGQLPTLAGLLAALWGLVVLNAYLRGGRLIDGLLAVVLMAVTAAVHHGTLLFVSFGVAAVCAQVALRSRQSRRRLLLRITLFGSSALLAILVVIWPFWQWGLGHTLQVPIDHPSRHNLLSDLRAQGLFFWAIYGPLVLLIPWAVRAAFHRKRAVLGLLFVLLFTLGLGGTTPLPRWLYGQAWAWLTYDRFALWASVVLLPFVGSALVAARCALRRRRPWAWSRARAAALLVMGTAACVSALLATLLPLQPGPLDMQPVVEFLAQDNRAQWRYLTFGFGDQLARLSLLTDATTIDGSYHTARELPELRASGIGQIDTAYWLPGGMEALSPIIERAGAYGVRWSFVNLRAYRPILRRHGWMRLSTLANGVEVWENPAAVRPSLGNAPADIDGFAATSWGILPLTALGVAGQLAWLRRRSNAKIVRSHIVL